MEEFLLHSGSYNLVDAEERLGSPIQTLSERCANRADCWQDVLDRAGADLVLIVRLSPTDSSALDGRVWMLNGTQEGTSPHAFVLPSHGGTPPDVARAVLLAPGMLSVRLPPDSSYRVELTTPADSSPAPGGLSFSGLSPGKHQVRILDGDDLKLVRVITVQPGATNSITYSPEAPHSNSALQRPRWAWYVAAALVGTTATALIIGALLPGEGRWRSAEPT